MVLFTRVLSLSVLFCLGFSWQLWISRDFYPLVPVGKSIPAFPHPVDYVVLATFCALLLAVLVRPESKLLICSIGATFAILFMQDQSRLWPSYYQFFFLFLLLASIRKPADEEDSHRVLSGMRFILAAIYFWSGVQKLTPHFFREEFPWFVEPLTDMLPFDVPYLPALGFLAALVEIIIGVGLFTKRFRNFALYDAMLMHVVILFCIGPLRGNFNNASWAWSICTAAQAWVLFNQAPAFDFRSMFNAPWRYNIPQILAVVCVGMLPLLNNVNLWDSALSFNVYSGNVSAAQIHVRTEVASLLPKEIQPFLSIYPDRAVLDLNEWSLAEFNANTYPENRIFKAVLRKVCSYLPKNAAYLLVEEKAGWFFPKELRRYECGNE